MNIAMALLTFVTKCAYVIYIPTDILSLLKITEMSSTRVELDMIGTQLDGMTSVIYELERVFR